MTAAATKSVVWGRYLKGEQAQRGAADYTRYVEYRDGDDRDREEGKRKFFDRDEKGIDGEEVRGLWKEQPARGPVMHELILSPGLNTVDQQQYTREIMDKLSRAKGQELQWYAAEHKNTDHHHVHVLVAGSDAEGRQVRIGRNDYKQVKEWGDRYLDREHQLDRYLARESDRLVTSRTYEHDRGDELFNKLFSPVHQEHEHEKTASKVERIEKQLQPEKPAYKIKEWDKERAVADLPDEQKIYRNNQAFSKYSSLDELKELDRQLQKGETARASKPEYAQLRTWLKEKERFGEDYHWNKDRKDFDKKELGKFNKREKEREKQKGREPDNKKQNRESVREFQVFDKRSQESYGPRQKGNFSRGVGKQRRVRELRGRTSEVHAIYQMNQSRQRLLLAMEREPENRDNYQKELEWLTDSYHDSIKDFEKLDLDSLFGAKERDRYQEDKKTGKERERGEEDKERDQKQNRESRREVREFDKPSRESYEPRQKGDFNRGVGKQQRVHELRGRTSEVHANYQINQSRQRLMLAMERDPENKGNYEKELGQLNESYRESLREFDRLDLDSLFGDKGRPLDDERKYGQTGKERGRGEDERDKKQNRESRSDVREFDKSFRGSYELKGDFNRGVGKQQRVHELRGRTSEVHANYQINLSRQRLMLAMERDPENKGNYEKELGQLNESYRESLRDFDRLDLDSLFGDKGRQFDDERKDGKTGKDREPGDDRAKTKEGKERAEGTEEKRSRTERDDHPTKTGERQQEYQREQQLAEEPQKTDTKDMTASKTQEQREKEEREELERQDREERGDDRGGR